MWSDTTAVLLSGRHPCALLLCDGHSSKVLIWYLRMFILLIASVRVERSGLLSIVDNPPLCLPCKLYACTTQPVDNDDRLGLCLPCKLWSDTTSSVQFDHLKTLCLPFEIFMQFRQLSFLHIVYYSHYSCLIHSDNLGRLATSR